MAEAKVGKAEAKATENARVEKEKEDAYWKDDDKHVARKQQRKVSGHGSNTVARA